MAVLKALAILAVLIIPALVGFANPASIFISVPTPEPTPTLACASIASLTSTPTPAPTATGPPAATPTPTATPLPAIRHVVIISVDGLSPDALDTADTPTLDDLRAKGT